MDDRGFVITIDPQGGVKIEAVGYSGAACEEATRALEDALGRTVKDERTEDFYRAEKAKVTAW